MSRSPATLPAVVLLAEHTRLVIERVLRHPRELSERSPWQQLEAELEGPPSAQRARLGRVCRHVVHNKPTISKQEPAEFRITRQHVDVILVRGDSFQRTQRVGKGKPRRVQLLFHGPEKGVVLTPQALHQCSFPGHKVVGLRLHGDSSVIETLGLSSGCVNGLLRSTVHADATRLHAQVDGSCPAQRPHG
eukprot:scaffold2483_cov135-Isochrysis_galbana.AAC.4